MRIEKIKKLLADYNKKKSILKNDSLIITYLKKCLAYNFVKDNENLDLPVFLKSYQEDHNVKLSLKDLNAISMETDLFENWWWAESLEILPNEIMTHLFSFLQTAEKKSMMATCGRFFSLYQDECAHKTVSIGGRQNWKLPFMSEYDLPNISRLNYRNVLISVVDKDLELIKPLPSEIKSTHRYDSPITADPIIMEVNRSDWENDWSLDDEGNPKFKKVDTTHCHVFTGHKSGEVWFNTQYAAPLPIISGFPAVTVLIPIGDYHIATGHTNGDVHTHRFSTKLTNLDLEGDDLGRDKLNDTPQLGEKSLKDKNKHHKEAVFSLLNYENEKTLYSCSAKTICKWNLMSGVTKILNPFQDMKNNDVGIFTAIDLLDKKTLLVGTDKGYIFKYDFHQDPIILGQHSNAITKIAHYKNNIITCAADGAIQVWLGQISNIKCVQVFQCEDGKIKDFNIGNDDIVVLIEKNIILKYQLVEKTIQKKNEEKPTVEIKTEEIKEDTILSKLSAID